jgi:hypothetical protein
MKHCRHFEHLLRTELGHPSVAAHFFLATEGSQQTIDTAYQKELLYQVNQDSNVLLNAAAGH